MYPILGIFTGASIGFCMYVNFNDVYQCGYRKGFFIYLSILERVCQRFVQEKSVALLMTSSDLLVQLKIQSSASKPLRRAFWSSYCHESSSYKTPYNEDNCGGLLCIWPCNHQFISFLLHSNSSEIMNKEKFSRCN